MIKLEHGGHTDINVNSRLNLNGDRLTLFSEQGKHAFAPIVEWLESPKVDTISTCGPEAGMGGLCIPPVIEGYIHSTTQQNCLIQSYLQTQAFIPSMQFAQIYDGLQDCLMPWSLLFRWIPECVNKTLEDLK